MHDWLKTFTGDEFNRDDVSGATLEFIDMEGLIELGIRSAVTRAMIMGEITAALEAE